MARTFLGRVIVCSWWACRNLRKIKHFVGREQEQDEFFSHEFKVKKKSLGMVTLPFVQLMKELNLKYTKRSFFTGRDSLSWGLEDLSTIVLMAIADRRDIKNIFEVGTYLGVTTRNLASDKAKKVFSLDLPQESITKSADSFEVGKYVKNEKFPNVTLISGDSRSLDFSPFEKKIDLFFIDGNHEYATVKNDTIAALRCTRKGGIIVWDDFNNFNMTRKGVLDALKENERKCSQLFEVLGTPLVVGVVD